VRLFTRRGFDWSDRFPLISEAARRLRPQSFVIDGEAVWLDGDGVSQFDRLHSRKRHDEIRLVAFDLLAVGDEDIRTQPLAPEAIQAAIASGIPVPIGGYDQQIDEGMKKRYAALEQEAAQYGITADVPHEIDESPAEAIVRVAEIKACDLIVMASHGRRGIRKALLGSQTAEVLVNTNIPVLVIR
jgi:nucleotide-binding universal stress UspA family protein